MGKGRITKIVGKISREVAEKYKLYEYQGVNIIQSMDLYVHVSKHREEFSSIDSYNHTLCSISDVISNPRFVYYDEVRNSLQYFKKIDENVCVVVKLNLRKNKEVYVSTVYPVSEKKILKYIEQSYIAKE